MSKSNHLQGGDTPRWNPAVALIVPALMLVLGACGDSGTGPNGPDTDGSETGALATLTAEAAAHLPTIDVSLATYRAPSAGRIVMRPPAMPLPT